MTVYIVNHGCYSDWGIDGVFSSKENAERYMDAFPREGEYDSYNYVLEIELDTHISQIVRGLRFWDVYMDQYGKVLKSLQADAPREISAKVEWYDNSFYRSEAKARVPWTRFSVWARDEQHAVKIANERRAMSIASEYSSNERS